MKKTLLPGLSYWGVYQEDRHIDFNGFFWRHPDGGILIDPMPLDDARCAELDEAGGVATILISNADHLRAALELKERFSATLLAPTVDRARFAAAADSVDAWFESADELPSGIDVHWVRGGKSEAEPCFVLRELNAIFFADVVRSHVSGQLMLLPDAKLTDRAAVIESLGFLRETEFDAILLGDGDPILRGAREVQRAFVELL